MKKIGEVIIGIVFCLAVLVFFAYLSLFQLSSQEAFLLDQAQVNGLAEVVDLDEAEIVKAYQQILSFSEGKRETLADQEDSFSYSKKEIHHMEDVRRLFLMLRVLGWISFCLIMAILYLILTKRLSGVRIWVSSVAGLAGIGILTLGAMSQFQVAFIRFHQIFFTNDLWLLNPKTDFLIQIMPEAFFVETAKFLFLRIGMGYGLLHLMLGAVYKYNRRNVLAE
jgi:integral membrane protein (TIGR01906 family)